MAEAGLIPAEAFPPRDYVVEEMRERGWDVAEMVRRMGGETRAARHRSRLPKITTEYVQRLLDGAPLSPLDAFRLARAFGTSAELWLNCEAYYRNWLAHQRSATSPHGDEDG